MMNVGLDSCGYPLRKGSEPKSQQNVQELATVEDLLTRVLSLRSRIGEFEVYMYRDADADAERACVARVSRSCDMDFTYHARCKDFKDALCELEEVIKRRIEGCVIVDRTKDYCEPNPYKMKLSVFLNNSGMEESSTTVDMQHIVSIDAMCATDDGFFRVYLDNGLLLRVTNDCYYKLYDAWVRI